MATIPATPSRRQYPRSLFGGPDYIVIAGSFEVDGTNDVTNVKGEGFTVDDSAVGVYTVTFPGCLGKGLISCTATVQADTSATADDLVCQVGVYTKATGVLELLTASDAFATLADGNGPRVNFIAVFHNRDSLDVTYTS